MNNKDAEYVVAFIKEHVKEVGKDTFMGNPNTKENRELLKFSMNQAIRCALMDVGIRHDLISTIVSGNKSEVKVSFMNNKTGEIFNSLEELLNFLKGL